LKINQLLIAEGQAETVMQSKMKSLMANAVKKHGLDKEAVMAEVRPQIEKLATENVRYFLKLGVEWLK